MSATQLHYLWNSYFANLLWALLLFALGLLLGWLLWNGRREKLASKEEANARLRAEYKQLSRRVHDNS